MGTFFRPFVCFILLVGVVFSSYATGKGNFSDTTRAYTIPLLTKTPKGDVALSWAEKDNDGVVYLYWAESRDKGKIFGDKKLIFSSPGIGNARLMKPKLLFKKDGSLVAVFSLRGSEAAAPQLANTSKAAAQEPSHSHEHGAMQHGGDAQVKAGSQKGAPQGGGRPRDSKIVYCLSKDQGNSWTQPVPVHTDNARNIVRGFFDAIVLANGEVGVAYLNDIEGKAHQRDLRFVSSKGDRFGAERILDPFVCDCCNISLLVDNSGTLQMYYRENQDNIRDIAKMSSKDNGLTFSKPEILFNDNWKINGCPHSGPTSSASNGNALIAWFSGSEDSPGIRVVTHTGKRLFVLNDPTAKNAYLVPAKQSSVLLWEQNQEFGEGVASTIAYKNVKESGAAETKFVAKSKNGTNASGLVLDNQLLIAYEVKNANNKNSIEWQTVEL